MISSIQSTDKYFHELTAPAAGDPQEDLDVLKHLEQQLEELIAELQKDGPSPELMKEINMLKGDIKTQLDKFASDEKAANGGQLPPQIADEIRKVNEDLDNLTYDMNRWSKDPSDDFFHFMMNDLQNLTSDIKGMNY